MFPEMSPVQPLCLIDEMVYLYGEGVRVYSVVMIPGKLTKAWIDSRELTLYLDMCFIRKSA